MSEANDLVIAALEQLNSNMNSRFDSVDEQFAKQNGRLRKAETEITRIKTLGALASALSVFFGWDNIKLWFVK
jgi:hypothetical protein